MKFHLSEEQEMIQDAVRRTVENIAPAERLRAIVNGPTDFDQGTWDALMALGVGGLSLPERFGGSGLGLLDSALVMEVLGETAACGPFLGHLLAGQAMSRSADEALRDEWLPRLADGSARGTAAFGDGWLPETWTATIADGQVTGEVAFVQGADVADVFVVGLAGGGMALVPAGNSVELAALDVSDCTRRLWKVRFGNAPGRTISDDPAAAAAVVDAGLVLLAADALGGAQKCSAMSQAYALQREQFGTPIAQFQAVKHQLADMAVEIEPARALVWYAAYAADAGLPDAPRAAAQAKAHLADRFGSVARSAVQVHGGIGYTWEYDLQIWFKRSLYDRAFLGAPSLHRERAAALAGW